MRRLLCFFLLLGMTGISLPAVAATVSGVVSAANSGEPIAGATVTLSRYAGLFYLDLATTTTNSQGEYAITHTHAGEAFVKARAEGFVEVQTAFTMPAGNGGVTVNLALPLPAVVTGRVAVAATGLPLSGKRVVAYSGSFGSVVAETASDGSYALRGLPAGSYSVCLFDQYDIYMNQCWDHLTVGSSTAPGGYTPVVVAAGELRSGVDFDLQPGAHLSGVVLNRRTGLPPASAPYLQAMVRTSAASHFYLPVQLDAGGRYRIDGLAPGSYHVIMQSSAPYYTSQLYRGIDCEGTSCNFPTGTDIVVTSPQSSRDDIDFSIMPGSRVQGRVLGADTQAPIPDAVVELWRRSFQGSTPFLIASVRPDLLGYYQFDHLNESAHLVVVRSPTHLSRVYPSRPCFIECTASAASDFVVPFNSTTVLETMLLDRGVGISGQAHRPGISGTSFSVSIYDASGQFLGSIPADGHGRYQFPAAVAGTYYLISSDGNACELYEGLACFQAPTNGTPIVLATPGDTSTVNFGLFVEGIHRAGFEGE